MLFLHDLKRVHGTWSCPSCNRCYAKRDTLVLHLISKHDWIARSDLDAGDQAEVLAAHMVVREARALAERLSQDNAALRATLATRT